MLLLFTGRLEALTQALFDGAKTAVEISLFLLGIVSLWLGITKVLGSNLETGNNIIRINIPITLTDHSLESRSLLDRIEEILSCDWIPGSRYAYPE